MFTIPSSFDERSIANNNQTFEYVNTFASNFQSNFLDTFDSRFVAVGGNPTVNVGASVYVWNSGNVEFDLEQVLLPTDISNCFGVQIDATTIAIGSSASLLDENDLNSISNAGAVFIYTRVGSVWTLEQKITAPVRTVEQFFGTTVGLSGDRIIVGNSVSSTLDEAYVFLRTGTTWALEQTIPNQNCRNVYIDDTVGKCLITDSTKLDVFLRTGTTWALEQTITESNLNYASIVNNTLVYSSVSTTNAGIMDFSGGTWTQNFTFTEKTGSCFLYDEQTLGIVVDTGAAFPNNFKYQYYSKSTGSWILQREILIGHNNATPVLSTSPSLSLVTHFFNDPGLNILKLISDTYEII